MALALGQEQALDDDAAERRRDRRRRRTRRRSRSSRSPRSAGSCRVSEPMRTERSMRRSQRHVRQPLVPDDLVRRQHRAAMHERTWWKPPCVVAHRHDAAVAAAEAAAHDRARPTPGTAGRSAPPVCATAAQHRLRVRRRRASPARRPATRGERALERRGDAAALAALPSSVVSTSSTPRPRRSRGRTARRRGARRRTASSSTPRARSASASVANGARPTPPATIHASVGGSTSGERPPERPEAVDALARPRRRRAAVSRRRCAC